MPFVRRAVAAGGVLLLFGVTASVASAQPSGYGSEGSWRPIRFLVSGGATVPMGGFGDVHDLGTTATGALVFRFAGLPFQIRTDIDYAHFNIKDVRKVIATAPIGAKGTSSMLGAVLNSQINLGDGAVHPYVLVGLGAMQFKNSFTGISNPGAIAEGKLQFAANGGAGISIKLWSIEAFIEGKIANVFTEKGAIDTKTITSVPVTFGFVF